MPATREPTDTCRFVAPLESVRAGSAAHKVGGFRARLWYGPATVSGRRTGSAARLAGLCAVLALAVGSTAAAAGPGSSYRDKAGRLQVQAQALDTHAHRALLDLYTLEARLGTARGQLAALERRSGRLRRRSETLGSRLAAAQHSLTVSQQQLGDHLRSLYEEGRPDPLAVVLGARSLDDALSKLDTLRRLADQSRRVVAVTTTAQARLVRVRDRLASERRRLDGALTAARRAAADLETARSRRLSFVSSLRARKQLAEAQIRTLLDTARAVEQKSQEIQAAAAAPSDPPAAGVGDTTTSAAPAPAPPSPRHGGGRTLRVTATGYSLPGHTATGLPVGWGIVAVDPSMIPLGTKLTVPGYGEAVAAAAGSAVRGADIDLWFPTLAQARAWGRRTVTITLH